MSFHIIASLGGGLVVLSLLVLFLLRRSRGSDGKTVFEKIEKAHEKDRLGRLIKQREDSFLNIVYGLAASMVAADGRVEQSEIDMAEKLGARLIPDFNDQDFLRVVNGHKQLPRFTDMVDAVAPLLPLDAKTEIFGYLQAIATSDGQISPDERHYIHHVEVKFGLDKLNG